MSVERLTTYENGLAKVKTNSPLVFQARLYRACLNRLARIEDILGDDYDLDRLRDLIRAHKLIGQEIYLPGDRVLGTVEEVSANNERISVYIRSGGGGFYISADDVFKALERKGEQDGTH